MNLHVELLDGKRMVFNLEENPVVHKFVQLVQSIRSGKAKVDYESYCMWTPDSFPKKKIIDDLNHSVEYFDKHNGYGETLKPVITASQDELNALHFEFEHAANRFLPNELLSSDHNRTIEKLPPKCDDIDLLAFHLNNINAKIHILEFAVGLKSDEKRAYFSIFLRDLLNDTRSIPLDTEDFKLFSLDAKFGDLMLGYGTTGKNLYHIYLNNDVNFFKEGNRESPQTAITTNILGWFSDEKKHHEEIAYLDDWLSKNCTGKFDTTDLKHSLGYIRLGKLRRHGVLEGLSDNETIDFFSNNHIADFYIGN
ncbi:hypothetical protein G6644_08595 [Polynucleobacter paneuropaeus]|nr:hypothetical protein [Polynucleobacter paneuropaeus]MBT8638554.1 hypothetical protein [Polynucleobacter paneuropaeus]